MNAMKFQKADIHLDATQIILQFYFFFFFCRPSNIAREGVAGQADIMGLVPCETWSLPSKIH